MLYLGLDAGATKTKAVLLSEKLEPIAQSSAEGANATAIGLKKALANVEKAILGVAGSSRQKDIKACLAIAGVDSKKSHHLWQKSLESSNKLQKIIKNPIIVNDTRAAMRSATTSKNAIVIVAGTGSNCWGINDSNQEAKAGGGGQILADQGSAYDIGLKIFKTVAKNLDGRIPETKLTALLFKKLKIKNREELIDTIYYGKVWHKGEIAQIAPLAQEAANLGDKSAIAIIKESVSEIEAMVKTVAKKLNLVNKKYDLVMVGSVFNTEKLFKEDLQNRIKKFSPNVNFPKQNFDSAVAAAHLAAESSRQ